MNIIIYAIPVFILTILVEALAARLMHRDVYDIPDAITSLQHGVLSQVVGAFTKAVTLGIYIAVFARFHAVEWPMNSVPLWLAAVVLYDFFYYWSHRLNHEVGMLWASHVVHHSSEYFNLSTALRQTSTGALFGWIFYLPMAVLGIPPVMFAIVALIDLLYQYWVHTELIGRLGILDRILVTPSNHRVHHGQNDYCIDKNYGGIFIVWDRLFGTFEDERAGEPIVYGIRKPLASMNPIWGNFHVYAGLWREARAASGVAAKLGVWLAPPGGWRDGPVEHFEPSRFHRYAPGTPRGVRWYAVIQYALTTVLIMHFLAVVPTLGWPAILCYAAVILAAAVSLGGLLDRFGWSLWFEPVRLAATAAAFVLLDDWFGFVAPSPVRMLVAAYAVASLGWLAFEARGLTRSVEAGA